MDKKTSIHEQPTATSCNDRSARKQSQKELSREIGLEMGALLGKHFLKLEHLNYGYWTDDIPVDITNLHIAQDRYARHLLAAIPEGVTSVLDVGCGMGGLARMLVAAGYQVDCVSPSPFLAGRAAKLLGQDCRIFECCYEKLKTDNRYDLVLFSESFQYIAPHEALRKTMELLNDRGYLLISDIFKKEVPGRCAISGGHSWSVFQEALSQFPFKLLQDEDITARTAPTIDIETTLFTEVGVPALAMGETLAKSRYPLLWVFLKWLFRKKIQKLQSKYLSGKRTGANFQHYKTYRTLLYQAIPETSKR